MCTRIVVMCRGAMFRVVLRNIFRTLYVIDVYLDVVDVVAED